MGQYWLAVSLTKKEWIDPHKLGSGLKLWEQLASHLGTGAALVILCAAMPEVRGGGDFDLDENWHGPERTFPEHNTSPGPMPESYHTIARRTIGRWAGDQIALVGDYATDDDLPKKFKAGSIYGRCVSIEEIEEFLADNPDWKRKDLYIDITDDVVAVIEHELQGRYEGEGWKKFKYLRDAK